MSISRILKGTWGLDFFRFLEILPAQLPGTTEGPSWGHPRPVLGAIDPYLEPFWGHLSPKVDRIFEI